MIKRRKLLVFLEVSPPRAVALGLAAALWFGCGGFARLALAAFLLALLLQKRAVVPFKAIKPSLVEAEQAINGAIEEITVVGNNDHAAPEVFKEVFENAEGLNIQIVGGFVQQQHVGRLDQHPAEGEAAALASRELGQGAVLLGRWKQKAFQKLGCGDLFTPQIDPAGGFFHELDHFAIEPFAFVEVFGVLVQVTDVNGLPKQQAALGWLAPSGDEIKQGGFAAAVGADDADSVFRAEAVAEAIEEWATAPAAIGCDPNGFRFDHLFADAPADAGHLQLCFGLIGFLLAHRFDALQSRLLFGAARLGALA